MSKSPFWSLAYIVGNCGNSVLMPMPISLADLATISQRGVPVGPAGRGDQLPAAELGAVRQHVDAVGALLGLQVALQDLDRLGLVVVPAVGLTAPAS